jgi:hypothetical protein
MPNLVGIGLSQVPTNSMLGGMAYQDPEHASIKNLDLKNLSQINSEIADTAVDVFVYDTRKDSDGGAWRKRTQNTSWYNETLGTATRGSRREFPAVAVIVAELNTLIIYDGDNPDLPMWMKFERDSSGNSNKFLTGSRTNTAVTAVNGIIAWCDTTDTQILKFIEDAMYLYGTGGIYSPNTYIANRNNTSVVNFTIIDSSVIILDGSCNDVAMTVLPNAPIDPSTGLPIPTIAVATDGGLSIIKDDGTVVDATPSSSAWYPTSVSTYGRNKFITGTGGAGGYILPVFDSDTSYNITSTPPSNGWLHFRSNGTNADIFLDLNENPTTTSLPITALSPIGAGSAKGMNIFDVNDNSHSDSLVAYVTSHYNTGWMHGDCKSALLSDTDTTNITGSEKIANYNFAADFSTQWEVKNSASASYDATNDRVTVTTTQIGAGIRLKSASLPTLTNGKRYIMTVDIHSTINAIKFGVVSGGNTDSVNSTGAHTLMFTAGASISEVYIEKLSGSIAVFALNSVSIREAEEDRSVNDKGLQVFGTITKSAVATGADLVAYSGFSNATNYMDNTSYANFGNPPTISVVFWQKLTDVGDYGYGVSFSAGTTIRGGISNGSASSGYPGQAYFNMGSVTLYTGIAINDGDWHCLVGTIKGTVKRFYLDGREVASATIDNYDMSGVNKIHVGSYGTTHVYAHRGSLALLRVSASTPSAEQIKKMYDDEKHLFQENSKATLYGSSDAVTALAYDDTTNLLHVGTSAGRSEFQGLRRINNTTDAVTTAISASNGLVAEQ